MKYYKIPHHSSNGGLQKPESVENKDVFLMYCKSIGSIICIQFYTSSSLELNTGFLTGVQLMQLHRKCPTQQDSWRVS